MTLIQRTWILFSRGCFVIAGLLLLAIAIPHRNPSEMSFVDVHVDEYETTFDDKVQAARPRTHLSNVARLVVLLGSPVTIHLPGAMGRIPFLDPSIPIQTSAAKLFLGVAVALGAMILVTPLGRQGAVNCCRRLGPAVATLLPAGLLIATLVPTKAALPVVLYLSLGSLGLLAVFVGLHRLVVWQGQYPFGKAVCRAVVRASSYLWNVEAKYFLAVVFVLAFAVTNLASYFAFEHIPHIHDGVAQVFHGKIFALGRLTVPSHELPEFFDFPHMINNGKWYSQYPPTHSALLMLGHFLGMPWLVNPLLGSLAIVTFYFIGREIYDDKTGRIAALLGLFSPFVIFMSSEYMNHASALLFLSLFVLYFAKTVNRKGLRHPLMAGMFLGVALNGRPLTAFAICIPFAVYAVVLLVKEFATYGARFFAMIAVICAFIVVLLLFNFSTNGDPLLFGYEVAWGKGHLPGFGHSVWGAPHTPAKGLTNSLSDLNGLNKFLFEWPIPSLFFGFLLIASRTRRTWDYLLVSSSVALGIAYFFYWHQNWLFGPRFFYGASGMAILLTARGIIRAPEVVTGTLGLKTSPGTVRATVGAMVVTCILVGLSFHVPQLVRQYSNNFGGVNASVLKSVRAESIHHAVVFVRSSFMAELAANSPTLDGDIVYARDLGVKNWRLMELYPRRKYYVARETELSEIFPPARGEILGEGESTRVMESSGDQVEPRSKR